MEIHCFNYDNPVNVSLLLHPISPHHLPYPPLFFLIGNKKRSRPISLRTIYKVTTFEKTVFIVYLCLKHYAQHEM